MTCSASPAHLIELLVLDGCPNAEAAHELIDRVSAALSLEPQLELVVVRDAEAAQQVRFLGSPTIRVNGRDIEPGSEHRTDYTLACRVYVTAGMAGLPDEDWLREALQG